jgi:hypothetical protein
MGDNGVAECFLPVCKRAATWTTRQAGTAEPLVCCAAHLDKALRKVLNGAKPPRPMAAVFAIVEPL